jgi:GAF domain-containing protein
MVRFFKGRAPVEEDFMSQQAKLRSMSGDVLRRYQRELDAEISDPDRLAAVYGHAFASSDTKRQAGVVAAMASAMLKVPNAAVNVITGEDQEPVAWVADGQLVTDPKVVPARESFCVNVITTGREMAVEDAREHPLVCDSRFVADGCVISYLGVPIANRSGIIVGSLCVFESGPRQWSTADVGMLTQLSMVLTRALPR